ncbi:hypothetical protein jhhlp_005232 [Lomentospora prolificans]|uniref:Mitochondrial outer membrane transport complex Sam37/metaxin N-terminal domain-containing protein n=1 Tax=Lomentospora prolificans TaxID=41688 RepID=A0A2N3N775_9PEZI|nr:hypothetical protein jhhlp_005232 [Lomentospora prolificans]
MALFELHVWGKAFGLESIDAECLAAIKFCSQAFRGRSHEWSLVESNDPSVCPSHRLPALLHDGIWVSGYRYIAAHIGRHLQLPDTLTPSQRADALSYETYLTSRISTLVDLSLYASSTNWSTVTRPAYSSILHFPLTWTVPLALRAEALQRVERFGFGELEADGRDVDEDEVEEQSPAFRWKGLTRRKKTVVEAMTAEQMIGIRLYSFAKDSLETIRDGVVDGTVALGDDSNYSATAWLLYAHLALMLEPEVPQRWLPTLLRTDFPQLIDLYDKLHTFTPGNDEITSTPYKHTTLATTTRFFHHVIQSIPTIGHVYTVEWRRRTSENIRGLDARSSFLLSAVLFSAPSLVYLYRLTNGLNPVAKIKARPHVWYVERKGRGLGRFGEIGAMLDFTMSAVGGVADARGDEGWGYGPSAYSVEAGNNLELEARP